MNIIKLTSQIDLIEATYKENLKELDKSRTTLKINKLKNYLKNLEDKYKDLESKHIKEHQEMFVKINKFEQNNKEYLDDKNKKDELLKKLIKLHEEEKSVKNNEIKNMKNHYQETFDKEQME